MKWAVIILKRNIHTRTQPSRPSSATGAGKENHEFSDQSFLEAETDTKPRDKKSDFSYELMEQLTAVFSTLAQGTKVRHGGLQDLCLVSVVLDFTFNTSQYHTVLDIWCCSYNTTNNQNRKLGPCLNILIFCSFFGLCGSLYSQNLSVFSVLCGSLRLIAFPVIPATYSPAACGFYPQLVALTDSHLPGYTEAKRGRYGNVW